MQIIGIKDTTIRNVCSSYYLEGERQIGTFQEVEEKSYDQLIEVFKKAFLPSPELKWTEASALWKNTQQMNESVNDYVIRSRKLANRLGMSDEVLHYAIINGLRPNIRTHVL